mgnify:CR=1 FL=1
MRFFSAQHKSRFPIYDKDIDNIIGVLHFKDAIIYYEKHDTNVPITNPAVCPYSSTTTTIWIFCDCILDRIPQDDEKLEVRYRDYIFSAIRVKKKTIQLVHVKKEKKTEKKELA